MGSFQSALITVATTTTLPQAIPLDMVPLQPPLGTLPLQPFNLHQVIADAVNNNMKTMERCMLQTLGHPLTYEDLLEEVE